MRVNVQLEDETLCAGCPFNTNERKVCGAGFARETARVSDMTITYHNPFNYWGGDERHGLAFQLVRPRACVLATDGVTKAIGKLPVKGAAAKVAETATEHAAKRRNGWCVHCSNTHARGEACRFGSKE